jgi:hypothetical protein
MAPARSLRAAPLIDAASFASIRRRLVLEGCKWDPQVGDASTVGRHALLLSEPAFATLTALATALARETLAAEEELAARPFLHRLLGVPRLLCRLWAGQPPPPPRREHRLMRFDFHPTSEGWRVSEVNSDVPGGFAESSLLPALFLPLHPGTRTAGDPAAAWADRIAKAAPLPRVALVSAPGFMEDLQVVSYLARLLARRGCEAVIARLEDVLWSHGAARLPRAAQGAVLRFVQAEWLLPWRRPDGWRWYFQASATEVLNAGTALLTESKRLPLAWPYLRAESRTWRSLLPPCCDPAAEPWRRDEGWILKGTFSNNGDAVVAPDGVAWPRAVREARRHPRRWVAQQRFDPVAVETPLGPRFPCLGVFTLGEEPIGIYGRLSEKTTIRHDATDVAVLIEEAA